MELQMADCRWEMEQGGKGGMMIPYMAEVMGTTGWHTCHY